MNFNPFNPNIDDYIADNLGNASNYQAFQQQINQGVAAEYSPPGQTSQPESRKKLEVGDYIMIAAVVLIALMIMSS
jgi:hypothetical protein